MRSLDSGYASRTDVSGVLGEMDAIEMVQSIAKACDAPWEDAEKANGNMWQSYARQGKEVKLVQYAALPTDKKARSAALSKLGMYLASAGLGISADISQRRETRRCSPQAQGRPRPDLPLCACGEP